jgi:hypothetical protein
MEFGDCLMCIAIFKPQNVYLTEEQILNSYMNNHHGWGFAVHDDKNNKIILVKENSGLETFQEKYEEHKYSRLILHFRYSSKGDIDDENCHPFLVNENLCFIHNGTINNVKEWNKTKSDTWHLNEAIIKPLVNKYGNDIVFDPIFKMLIEDYIGFSKLIFMDNFGSVIIYNQNKDPKAYLCKQTGTWFSNNYYNLPLKQKREKYVAGGVTYYTGNGVTTSTTSSVSSFKNYSSKKKEKKEKGYKINYSIEKERLGHCFLDFIDIVAETSQEVHQEMALREYVSQL